MAPELILLTLAVDERLPSRSTKESDVYAFAMVAIEVLLSLSLNLGRGSPTPWPVSLAGVHWPYPISLVPA